MSTLFDQRAEPTAGTASTSSNEHTALTIVHSLAANTMSSVMRVVYASVRSQVANTTITMSSS